jgi:hypothetical protein
MVVAVVSLAMACIGAPAQAATAASSGYWWVGESGTVPVPAPPQVPAKGLYIASNAAGPTAVSAVRFALEPDRANPQLVLTVHQLQVGDTFAVDAYPATATWTAGDAQPWSSRPSYDARATPTHGVLSADGKTVTFSLTSVLAGGTGNVALVPGAATPAAAGAPSAPSPTFDAVFEPLGAGAVTTTMVQPDAVSPAPAQSAPAAQPPAALPPAAPALLGPLVPPAAVTAAPSVASPLPAVTPQPLAQPATTGQTRRTGWSTRDLAILVFLLVDATLYLGWLARSQPTTSRRISIYDLPETA